MLLTLRSDRRAAATWMMVGLLAACSGGGSTRSETERVIRINGSSTVNPVMTEIAEILRSEHGLAISVDVQGGSSGGISSAADGSADIGMSSKSVSREDRRRFGSADLRSISIGSDAVALGVHRSVADRGVVALNRAQVRDVYEKKITNWIELGGPDQPIVFFDKEPGRGTWEVFAEWLYPDADAPTISHSQVGGNEEGRSKVATTPGAITQLSASWVADTREIAALGLIGQDGSILEPSRPNVEVGLYPMTRPLLLITSGPPDDLEKLVIDFALSDRGQQIVERHGYLPVGLRE